MTCLSDFLEQKTALEPGWGAREKSGLSWMMVSPQALGRRNMIDRWRSGYSGG